MLTLIFIVFWSIICNPETVKTHDQNSVHDPTQ